jgi:LmbE family N-acetylglucosaminyl deacetylase
MESIVLREAKASRRLLVVFAHPDDESFGPAGTIVHYASQGVAVHYVCATRGEAGDVDPDLLEGCSSLAELRSEELLCAAGHLGLAGLHFLDYHDSGMENALENQNPASLMQAPLEEVTEKITRLMRQIQPQVVLTHDPSGGYFHPDHIKANQATVQAFHSAGHPDRFPEQLEQGLAAYQPKKLYYTAFPRGLMKLFVRILPLFGQNPEAFGRNNDINVKRIAEVEQAVTTKIGIRPYFEASQQAARCHASQTGGASRRVMDLMGWLARFDTFTRAIPPYEKGRVERDLFAGMDEGPGRATQKTVRAHILD